MQQLNFCRQILGQCNRMLAVPSIPSDERETILHAADLCRASQKFLLPKGGIALRDNDLRALEDDIPVHLPHPFIALEHEGIEFEHEGKVSFVEGKVVLLCREHDDVIWVTPAAWTPTNGIWLLLKPFCFPKLGFLQRAEGGNSIRLGAKLRLDDGLEDLVGAYKTYAKVVLAFLNALSCSNVRTERLEPKRTAVAMRKKDALPFDTYHVLTVEVTGRERGIGESCAHRSPREHLRRGHIRRLEDGRKLWINATVVNPGVGGRVQKDYRLAA